MKNYTYGWVIKNDGYTEVPEYLYSESQKDMNEFIKSMSSVIESAKCGWDCVMYKVMANATNKVIREYMVLFCNGHDARWIPIDCNSKGCNFSVLGENLW